MAANTFRFGHDFSSPPPLPVRPPIKRQRLEVEAARTHSDGVVKSADGVSGLEDGAWLRLDDVDFGPGWQSAVLRIGSNVKEMNSDGSARTKPRHTKATDPLAMEAIVNDGTQE